MRRGQDARGLARRADEDGERRPLGRHRNTRLDGLLESEAHLTFGGHAARSRSPTSSREVPPVLRTGPRIHKRISNSFRVLRWPCVGGASSQIERRARPGWALPEVAARRERRASRADVNSRRRRAPGGAATTKKPARRRRLRTRRPIGLRRIAGCRRRGGRRPIRRHRLCPSAALFNTSRQSS